MRAFPVVAGCGNRAVTVVLLVTGLALGGFLYVRTDIPSDVQEKITAALERADDTPKDGSMSEEEAIAELKDQYASGNIDDHELDQALEDALMSDRPEQVVRQYE
jgi:ABC-type phosphate/phosphonate transport system substrate-binding protein